MNRKIPIISLEDFEAKSKKPLMVKTLVTNIAEIKNYDLILNIPKSEWKGGLEKALEYYIEGEEYEQCSKVRDLINKL